MSRAFLRSPATPPRAVEPPPLPWHQTARGGGRRSLQWPRLRCWRYQSDSEKELGNRGRTINYSTNKGRRRTRKTKQFLFQGAPELPFAVLTNRGETSENTVYKVLCVYVYIFNVMNKYLQALWCKASVAKNLKVSYLAAFANASLVGSRDVLAEPSLLLLVIC